MKHYVNFALLFSFVILVGSAFLRFFEPFDLITTRVHIVFGATVLALVGLHLASRPQYFVRILKRKGKPDTAQPSKLPLLILPAITCGYLLIACIFNVWPAPQLLALGYESKNRSIIFRPEEDSVSRPLADGLQLKRRAEDEANALIDIQWSDSLDNRSKAQGSEAQPQVAIWAETSVGTLIETFYVSPESAYSETVDWAGHSYRRVEVLPLWRNRFTLASGVDPMGEVDSYSGATPDHSFSIEKNLKEDADGFYICVEINEANDENETYHSRHDVSDPNYMKPGLGQPSSYYSAYIDPSENKKYSLLDFVGHGGSSNQQDGHVNYDSSGLTTARNLLDKVLVRILRSEKKTSNPTEASTDISQ